jgi:hypothetical protein
MPPMKGSDLKRGTWLTFFVVQTLGLACARFGALESESLLRRTMIVCSWVLLLPGNIPAAFIDEPRLMMHVPVLFEWLIFGTVIVAGNALVWVCTAHFFRILLSKKLSWPSAR